MLGDDRVDDGENEPVKATRDIIDLTVRRIGLGALIWSPNPPQHAGSSGPAVYLSSPAASKPQKSAEPGKENGWECRPGGRAVVSRVQQKNCWEGFYVYWTRKDQFG